MSSGILLTDNNRADLPSAGRSLLFVNASGDLILRDAAGVDTNLSAGGGGGTAIPAGESTFYVNPAAGAGGDGSVSTPFQTLADGLAAIVLAGGYGTLIAAAGSYAENVTLGVGGVVGLRIIGQAPSTGATSGTYLTGNITVGNSTTCMLEGIAINGLITLGDGFAGYATLAAENVSLTGNIDGTAGNNCRLIARARGHATRGISVSGTVNMPAGGGQREMEVSHSYFGGNVTIEYLTCAHQCMFGGNLLISNLGNVRGCRMLPAATLTVNGEIWTSNRPGPSTAATGFYECVLSGVALAGSSPIPMDSATLHSMQYDANGGGAPFPTPDPTTGCVIYEVGFEGTSHLFGGRTSGGAGTTQTGGGLSLSDADGFDNLIVNAGDTLNLNGWALFVRGHLILEAGATIISGLPTAAAGATGGDWAPVTGPFKGGQGGDADPGFGVGVSGSNESPSRGGNGGNGGVGDNGGAVAGGNGGVAGASTSLLLASPMAAMSTLILSEGGAGGGGGGGDGAGVGGGGGFGGGPILIFAKFLHADPTATIVANGGDGAAATGINAGGGGGGGGGSVYVAYAYGSTPTDVEALISVAGGAGGAGNGLGASGTAGVSGSYHVTCLSRH